MGATTTSTPAIRLLSGLAEIDQGALGSCANPGWGAGHAGTGPTLEQESQARPYNPFVSWDFLEALERSGTVSAKTGWAPRHAVLVENGATADAIAARPGAVMPCYVKSHSQGEYVFD